MVERISALRQAPVQQTRFRAKPERTPPLLNKLIVLAQRQIERRREPGDHIATGGGAPDLQETQMALRNAGPAGKLELRPSPASTPRAQAGRKLRFGSHDYLSGSCIEDVGTDTRMCGAEETVQHRRGHR